MHGLFAAGVAVLTVSVALSAEWYPGPSAALVITAGYSLVWLVAGYAVRRVQPGAALGGSMMAFAVADMIGTDGNLWVGESWGFRVLRTVAGAITLLQPAWLLHMTLTFPSGRADDRLTAAVTRAAWWFAGAHTVAVLLTWRRPEQLPACRSAPCTEIVAYVLPDPAVQEAVRAGGAWGWAVLIGVALVVVLRRWYGGGPRLRRLQGMPTLVTVVFGVLAIVHRFDDAATDGLFHLLLLGSVAAVPGAFVYGLLRERTELGRVCDLVRLLGAVPVAQLRPALAEVLDDPRLRLVIASPGQRLRADADHRRQAVTDVGPAGRPAVLIHDASLLAVPRLMDAVRCAVRLALENDALRARVRRQLEDVRASRARLVEAADTARRRIERDLHDGAQQRLLATGLALRAIRGAPGGSFTAEAGGLLDAAEREVRAAIGELRELARGIHPAVLTEQGLAAALEQLALHAALPVELRCAEVPRLPAPVEATAYFVVCEAVTNAVKHAAATHCAVAVAVGPAGLVVEVTDDGVGGACVARGTGLRGIADRAAAVGGSLTVESPRRGGTCVKALLPTA